MFDDVEKKRLIQWHHFPSVFVRDVFNVDQIFDYQQRFLDKDSKYKQFVAGRQVGKTRAIAWLALHKLVTSPPNTDILVFSNTESQVLDLFNQELKPEIDKSGYSEEEWGIVENKKKSIVAANESRIVALPATNRKHTVRGYTADMVIVDESAFIQQDFFTEIIGPMLMTTQGDYIISSTPYGKSGFFWDKWTDDRWMSVQVSSYDNPLTTKKYVDNEIADGMSERQYKQEILGQFDSSADTFFDADNINSSIIKTGTVDKLGRQCFLGVDFGRGGPDRSVLTSIDETGNIFDITSSEGKPISHSVGQIRKLWKKHRYNRIYIDETGMETVFEDLKRDIRGLKGFKFTRPSRADIYTKMQQQFEDGNISIPQNDDGENLQRELLDMDEQYTNAGNLKVHHPPGGHDDYADSLALAIKAWKQGRTSGSAEKFYDFNDSSTNQVGGRQAHSFN